MLSMGKTRKSTFQARLRQERKTDYREHYSYSTQFLEDGPRTHSIMYELVSTKNKIPHSRMCTGVWTSRIHRVDDSHDLLSPWNTVVLAIDEKKRHVSYLRSIFDSLSNLQIERIRLEILRYVQYTTMRLMHWSGIPIKSVSLRITPLNNARKAQHFVSSVASRIRSRPSLHHLMSKTFLCYLFSLIGRFKTLSS